MDKIKIFGVEEAFLYITDCNLVTVSHMAGLKSKSKNEYNRQINIAQMMIYWINYFDLKPNSRAKDIIDGCNSSVAEWVKKYEV